MLQITEQATRYPDRVRLPLDFDPALLVRDLGVLERGAWTQHFVSQNYAGDWSVIPLRACAGETHPIRLIYSDPGATAWVDTPQLALAPYFAEVIAAFRCPVKNVRLMRLTPGSVIHEHDDGDLKAECGVARVHVPVTTNPSVAFLLNGERVDMAPGETWYLRLSDRHSVRNDGDTDRVHLVLDVAVDDWFERMLTG